MGRMWIKSSLSFATGNCVEVKVNDDGSVTVRNSRHQEGPVITYTAAEWSAFIAGARLGEFDFAPA